MNSFISCPENGKYSSSASSTRCPDQRGYSHHPRPVSRCPGPAVIAGDFSKGLTAAIARKAAQDAKQAEETETKSTAKGKEKEIQPETSLDESSLDDFDYPLPTAPEARPEYEADSQTIIVDWVRDVEPVVVGPHLNTIIL